MTTLLIVLSVVDAVLLVAVLALALIEIRRRLTNIATGLATLGSGLSTVESQHLRGLGPVLEAINDRLFAVLAKLPGIADKAALVVTHSRRR